MPLMPISAAPPTGASIREDGSLEAVDRFALKVPGHFPIWRPSMRGAAERVRVAGRARQRSAAPAPRISRSGRVPDVAVGGIHSFHILAGGVGSGDISPQDSHN